VAGVRVAYIDMIGGAAGDMLMAAWVDAGVDAGVLERALRGVVSDGWELTVERVVRAGVTATHLDLVIPGEDDHAHGAPARPRRDRRLRDILAIVEDSALAPRQIERARTIYRRLAAAEARVRDRDPDEMSFHDVGQIDAILDVAGTCVALDLLGIDDVRCSAFPVGHGVAHTAHGVYVNPSPAALELMRGFALRPLDVEAELVTVTGAAIVSTLATAGPAPAMTLERVGYGAGRREFAFPNVVRVTIGELEQVVEPA
jgi:uncharacterized protein (DUF111 family)